MPSAMRGCVIACTSLKNEEEGAVPPRNTDKLNSFIEQGHFIDAFYQAYLACMFVNSLSRSHIVLELTFYVARRLRS